ncbi:Ysw1p KNAG_0K02080 [Huiozyma naganishii CBS 8797]|uniref:Uncharacterized protein n=1 Tax=Huiozyma naganishii (strain ATCC MYA-139 / BCRC 22969 / CBS 8797 / KCTC 17520 / NBRC 10181 / NCYC 3082 / Yp74L-3) TaxID=1071383 RepID=J7S3F2_HUIN7|nr:hypothetical protein KNAG_0K02080 [Kazachstania naganishii CBS 8797]CCK72572.1 hypothetical protein KNAG_0K02080 [Kazachstania naganishii CBS 8797]
MLDITDSIMDDSSQVGQGKRPTGNSGKVLSFFQRGHFSYFNTLRSSKYVPTNKFLGEPLEERTTFKTVFARTTKSFKYKKIGPLAAEEDSMQSKNEGTDEFTFTTRRGKRGTLKSLFGFWKQLPETSQDDGPNNILSVFEDTTNTLSLSMNNSVTIEAGREYGISPLGSNKTNSYDQEVPTMETNVSTESDNDTSFEDRPDAEEISPPTPPEKESPYKFVFDTPNKYSTLDNIPASNEASDNEASDNFEKIHKLLSKDNKEIFKFNNTWIPEDLSKLIMNLLEEKIEVERTKTQEMDSTNKQLKEELRHKEKELELLKTDYETLAKSHKQLENDCQSLQKEKDRSSEAAKGTLQQKLEDQALQLEDVERSNRKLQLALDRKSYGLTYLCNIYNNLVARYNRMNNHTTLLECYKEQSSKFMFTLMKKMNGIVDEDKLITYNVALKNLSFKTSLLNMENPNGDQVDVFKNHIVKFYHEVADDVLLNDVVAQFSRLTRSNQFLKNSVWEWKRQCTSQGRLLSKMKMQQRPPPRRNQRPSKPRETITERDSIVLLSNPQGKATENTEPRQPW